ncbi:MAG: type VI secretion system tube protein Hcp [Burkholderiaceae bacterium]
MSSKIFLKIGDIKGESTDDKHKEQIEVFSWSWGVTNATTLGPASGNAAGRPSFNDLNFMHRYDKAAPLLWRACAVGQHFAEATLVGTKQGKAAQDYLVVKMSDVVVTSANASDSSGGGEAMESVGVKFAKVDVEYKPQKADGSFDVGVRFKYDIKNNKEF